MALEYAHGAIQWLSSSTVGTTYVVSGLAFQPKALRFFTVGIGSATDAATATVDMQRSMGFATGTAARRCIGTSTDDAGNEAFTSAAVRNDCVIIEVDFSNGTPTGLLDLNAVASDGFTLIVDNQSVQSITVMWDAWGGSDITVATVGDFAEPSATGVQTYSVSGFTSAATNQVVMLCGCDVTTALNTDDALEDSNFYVGYTTGTASANNVVVVGNSDRGSTLMDTDGYTQTGECLALIVNGGGNPDARATLSAWNTDNFALNWLEVGAVDRKSIFLAIKGGNWTAGSYTIDGSTGGATATVSGLSYAPVGVCLMGHGYATSTVDTANGEDLLSFGSGSSTTSRRALGMRDENGTATCEMNLVVEYDQILAFPNAAGALLSAFDLNAMNSDGFQIITDVAGGVASEWQGYLAFGAEAAGSTGTLTVTTANDTISASGTTTVTGTLAKTAANDTIAAAGTTTVIGTLAVTTAADTLAASGTTTVIGTLAVTAANDTLAASGSVGNDVTGTLAVTTAPDTLVAAGTTTVVGTLAVTTANDTLAAVGTGPAVATVDGGGNFSGGSFSDAVGGFSVDSAIVDGGGKWQPEQSRTYHIGAEPPKKKKVVGEKVKQKPPETVSQSVILYGLSQQDSAEITALMARALDQNAALSTIDAEIFALMQVSLAAEREAEDILILMLAA